MFEQAKWIWCKGAPAVNAYALFECDFEAPAGAVRLDISADQQYAVYLNGSLAFAGQYPDYPEYKVYDSEDVTALLHPGKNTLRVEAYCIGRDNFVYRCGSAGVIFELTGESGVIAASGEHTRAAVHPHFVSGEHVDPMTNQQGFTYAMDFTGDAPAWENAVCVPGADQFHPRPVRRLVTEPRRPARLISQGVYSGVSGSTGTSGSTNGWRMQHAALAYREKKVLASGYHFTFPNEGVRFESAEGEGVYLTFDLGEEDVGWPEIEIETDEPCEVLFGWGEHLDDLRPRTYVGKRNFAVSYKLPAGRTSALNPLKRIGLRYLQLFVPAKAFTLYYAGIRPANYPFDRSPEFHVSDALHTRIAEVSRRTLIGCAHEHYEDCPWREQALYAMDSRNQMLCGYYAFGEYDMPRESLRLLGLSIRDDNMLEICAPARGSITIPSFTAAYLVELSEYYLFSGDAEFFREMLPVARQIADGFIARMGENGLIPVYQGSQFWNFYEWQPGLQGEIGGEAVEGAARLDAPMNCFAILGLTALLRAMEHAGEDASRYREAVETLKKAVREMFWNAEKQAFASYKMGENRWHYAELTQALAVCAGVADGEMLDAALERLTDETLIPVTLSYSIFQFDALMKRPEKYARWVFERVARDWGKMLYAGATTFWETILGGDDFEDAGSLCHGWSAVPLYLYYRYALGAYPTRPGFAEYEVKPIPCGLYELSGTVKTADGRTIRL